MTNDELLEMLRANAKSNPEPSVTPVPKPPVTPTNRAGSRRPNHTLWVLPALAVVGIVGLSLYRGPLKNPVDATGSQLATGQHTAGERLTVSAYFDRYLATTNGQVKWKLITKDGYPLTVVLDQGLHVPINLRAGKPLQVTVTPIGPQVASLHSAQDVVSQPDHENTYEYVGVFIVTNEEGFGHLPTGEQLRFHAAGFKDGTYNHLTLGFDTRDEAVALTLETIDNPDSLRIR